MYLLGKQYYSNGYYFYRKNESNDNSVFWCCNGFTTEYLCSEDKNTNEKNIEFKVCFRTELEQKVEFLWDLTSLSYLSQGNLLQQVLYRSGVRCSPEREAMVAIINAIQCDYLVCRDEEA